MHSYIENSLLLDVFRGTFKKQSHQHLNRDDYYTFPKHNSENIVLSSIIFNCKGTNNNSYGIWGKKRKNDSRANQKDLFMREPDIGKLVGSTDHEAKTQRTNKISNI